MATMRNGLDTWLKNDCAEKALDLIEYGDDIFGVDDVIMDDLVTENTDYTNIRAKLGGLRTLINSMLSDSKINGFQSDQLLSKINVAEQYLTTGVNIKAGIFKLHEVLASIRVMALEKVVECQCGKHGIAIGSRIRELLTNKPGIVEKIESGKYFVKLDDGSTLVYNENELRPL